MNNRKALFLVLILCFLNTFEIISQTIQQEQQPLTTILKRLESRYNVSFSYADNHIKNISSPLPNNTLSLEEALGILEKHTLLQFETLNNRFVVITKPQTTPPKVEQLDEVFITKYLTKGLSISKQGHLIIKPKEFDLLPGLTEPDVLQTIQTLPSILSVDETVSNINVRGGTHDQNLILWEGIKMYQSGHFFGLISAFNPYLTEKIQVTKNGSSAKYGDGVSSVIDMQLTDSIEQKSSYGAGVNLISIDGFAKTPISNNSSIQIAARRSLTDAVKTPTYNQYTKRVFQDSDLSNTISSDETFYFYDISAKYLHNVSPKDKFQVYGTLSKNTLDYKEQANINGNTTASDSYLKQVNLAGGLSYSRHWNNKLTTTAEAYISNYNLNAANVDLVNKQRLKQENEVFENTFKLHLDYSVSPYLKLEGGYQFFEVGISNFEDVNNPPFNSYIKEVIRTHSGYVEGQLSTKNQKTLLKIGARTNYISKFKTLLVEPRVRFNQKFLNFFKVELLGELKSQTTSQIIDLQKDFLGIEKRRWVLANNTTIPIIKSKQASLGLHFNKNRLLVSAEGFIKHVDGITTRSQGFQNQYQFTNATGHYKTYGIDFLINKHFNNLSTWLSYTYSKNDYVFRSLNNNHSFPNNIDIRHQLSFAGSYAINRFKIALGLNWHTGRPYTTPKEFNQIQNTSINYQSPNSQHLNDYLRTDISTTYTFSIFKNKQAVLGASVWNVLNRKNIINTYYTLEDSNTVNKVENTSLGITPNFSFRVNL
ncbi:TonB-dependent receptor plug domain-containing protein [Mangrovimonas spongiae]|uniref:TonB-dependent receptor plug domain-containing protein n=1 Tax=Mangrovimonas spongiae TaxID=2494697 RepID=UPI001F0C359A|nr:TonB-dependent receptor plug domain-containing protein [Mangrovimonas spongiae]